MKNALFGTATILGLLTASRAEAGVLYTTTDLGANYQILADADGQDYGVKGSNGVSYAFDKSPVTQIDMVNFIPGTENYTRSTMQAGPYQVGGVNGQGTFGSLDFPSFEGYATGWALGGLDALNDRVVTDINIQGQVVGTSGYFGGSDATFAAFSAVGAQSHDPHGNAADALISDNLNNYIATIPGATLTSAVAIDDLGRIIAYGSNGQSYLLTPEALGAAATIPEPTTALMMGLAGSFYAIRSISRRRRS